MNEKQTKLINDFLIHVNENYHNMFLVLAGTCCYSDIVYVFNKYVKKAL